MVDSKNISNLSSSSISNDQTVSEETKEKNKQNQATKQTLFNDAMARLKKIKSPDTIASNKHGDVLSCSKPVDENDINQDINQTGDSFKINLKDVNNVMKDAEVFKPGVNGWTDKYIGFEEKLEGEKPGDGITATEAKIMHLELAYEDELAKNDGSITKEELQNHRSTKNFLNAIRDGDDIAKGLDLNGNHVFEPDEAKQVSGYDTSDGKDVLSDKDIKEAFKKYQAAQINKSNNEPDLKVKKLNLAAVLSASGNTELYFNQIDELKSNLNQLKISKDKKISCSNFLDELKNNPDLFKEISNLSYDSGDNNPENLKVCLTDLTR